MSGGEVLRHLLEEQQSYQVHALAKQRSAKEQRNLRENSPMLKTKGTPSKNVFHAPRRALSDQSPMMESHSSMISSKSNSMSTTESPYKPYSSSTTFSPPGDRTSRNYGHIPKPKLEERPTGNARDDQINSYEADSSPFLSPSNNFKPTVHPKSNSAGEDGYHSNRRSKFADMKANKKRSKTTSSIIRSRSLHSAEKSSSIAKAVDSIMSNRGKMNNALAQNSDPHALTSRKQEFSLSRADIIQVSANELNTLSDLPRSGDSRGTFKDPEHSSYEQLLLTRTPNNMVSSGMGGISQPSIQQTNPHGPYYATVPQTSISKHHLPNNNSSSTPSKQTSPIAQSSSIPRGPPPPYPQAGASDNENLPQRPNSLSLSGQVSRKKLEYGGAQGNVAGLTSPAIPTTSHMNNFSYPMSAGTPPHESIFRSFPEVTKANELTQESIAKTLGILPPNQQSQYLRTGYGQGVQVIVSSSQTQNTPEHTNATPSSAVSLKQLRTDQSRNYNATSTPQKQMCVPPPSYSLPSFGEFQPTQQPSATGAPGFSLGKSDSNASTCSGGSRIARRTKRNSRNFSNVSGSSSSTGNSRPNSSADYLERILNENEALKNQLVSADMKLKKYQNVEKELSQITEDYHNFRLSVTKSENMQSTLISQLESAASRTQQENGILRERINTLTELVETLQSSNKEDKSPSTDVSAYKIKVKELQAKESRLSEQYEEALEKISDQEEDIGLLNMSLERMQTSVASLKERLVEKQKLDRYAEKLTPFLDALTTTIQSREEAERELSKITVMAQRQSTSSNDEGISEMDSADYLSRTTGTREQFVRAHAQMLKWQHTYLQTAILRELSTFTSSTVPSPLYSVLRKHRHAISEPSYCGIPRTKKPSTDSPNAANCEESSNHVQNSERANHEHPTSSSRQCSATNMKPDLYNRDSESSDCTKERFNRDKATVSNTETPASNETDSPSEGYHSQQSSGSPTPSFERSSLHFPEGESSNNAKSQTVISPGLFSAASGKTILTKVVDV